MQLSRVVILLTPNHADGISPELPLQRGILPPLSPDCPFQDKSLHQQDTGQRLPGTAVCKAFLSRVQACTRVPAPLEASGVPPHSRSVPSSCGSPDLSIFQFTRSAPALLLWPGVGTSLGDSDTAQCECALDICGQ